jgi:hypothetical protein
MFYLMPLLLFRVMLRRQWLACAAFVAINVLFGCSPRGSRLVTLAIRDWYWPKSASESQWTFLV